MNERIRIEKPQVDDVDINRLVKDYVDNLQAYSPLIQRINEEDYLYWDRVKYLEMPPGIVPERLWLLIKMQRRISSRPTPIQAPGEGIFTWYKQDALEEYQNRIDKELGGNMATSQPFSDDHQKFMVRGILEEAIASSQLEGASTTRRVARRMLAEQRSPRNHSERMIYNNYLTMQHIEKELSKDSLTRDMLLGIHVDLTAGTLEAAEQVGRWRKDEDDIVVDYSGDIAHIPPLEKHLQEEIDRLIEFANDDNAPFMHPVVKAIMLHFWVGYLHPFTDGNGRVARALFYWYLLKHDYWIVLYLPVSTIIKRAPRQYAYAYIYSEQDDRDVTYFINYNVNRLLLAMDDLKTYIKKIDRENRQIDAFIGPDYALNSRQKQVLHYLVQGNAEDYVTITSHQTLNGIARLTADRDLKNLLGQQLVRAVKVGRTYHFYVEARLQRRFKRYQT